MKVKRRTDLVSAVSELVALPPFVGDAKSNRAKLLQLVSDLTDFHAIHCEPYQKIVDVLFPERSCAKVLSDIPYIPVRLFKTLTLRSIATNEVMKTMTSSGTSGMATSQVYLDRDTASLQTKALAQTMSSILGTVRVPMLIVDSPSTTTDRNSFSARGAGVRGFSMFGRPVVYALDGAMNLRIDDVKKFADSYGGGRVLLFGFTSVVWEHLLEKLHQLEVRINLSRAVLVHGGGWKKLASVAVSPEEFAQRAKRALGVDRVINYYGMVEQTGSIFLECENGFLHASTYGDIIVRDDTTYLPLPCGEEGLIQSISALPISYPGHSVLTEDRGVALGQDDCFCGRSGTYFRVLGRIKDAEVRGCSDAYAR